MPDYSKLRPNEIIELYKTQDIQGLEFSKVRKDLEEGGAEEEDIQIVFRVLDNLKYKNEFRKKNKSTGLEFVILGLVMGGFGVIITIVTLVRGYDGTGTYVLAYGPILAGISSFLYGRNLRQ